VSALFGVPVDAAYHVVFALTNALTPALGGLAAVAAIIMFTVAVRLLVTPLTFRALRGQAAQARLAPQVQRLRERHAHQPDRFNRELTALYKQAGTSPFAGFAPLLAQWPVFSVLYLLFRSPTAAGGTNLLLSRTLFGVPLGSHWLSGAGAFSAHGAVFAGVLVALAAACWLLTRIVRRALPAPGVGAPGTEGAGKAVAAVLKVVPYITVAIAAFAPLAAAIYLVTSTAWSGAERLAFAARTDRNRAAVPRPTVRGTVENG
jgi:YidC/Oxa1 family membrane protein insertase